MNKQNRCRRELRLKSLCLGLTLVLPLALVASSGSTPQGVQPVELRVRVFDGARFVDGLGLKDFDVYENGRLQQAESLSLLNGQTVVREEGAKPGQLYAARSYYFLFQTVDWDPALGEAIDYLFTSVIRPGDSMMLITPMKPYSLQANALAQKPKATLSKDMQHLLKQDIQRGGTDYRNLIRRLKRLTNAIGSAAGGGGQPNFEDRMEADSSTDSSEGFGLEFQIQHYRDALMELESQRLVDEKKLMGFAQSLKAVPGEKSVFFFYAREYRPEIGASAMQTLMTMYQDNPTIAGNMMDLFQFYRRDPSFDRDLVKREFSDAGIVLHFIFMDKKSQRVFGANMREQSEDIFPGFKEIARATGGTCETSKDPGVSFRRAAAESQQYYLLRYIPQDSPRDGTFKSIEVKVKASGAAGKAYTVANRDGYYAR